MPRIGRITPRCRSSSDSAAAATITAKPTIPGAGRRDEIGGMADAVQVFKDGLIRARALEEETADRPDHAAMQEQQRQRRRRDHHGEADEAGEARLPRCRCCSCIAA
jgi:methyl-accepting chemotaxis protein